MHRASCAIFVFRFSSFVFRLSYEGYPSSPPLVPPLPVLPPPPGFSFSLSFSLEPVPVPPPWLVSPSPSGELGEGLPSGLAVPPVDVCLVRHILSPSSGICSNQFSAFPQARGFIQISFEYLQERLQGFKSVSFFVKA